MVSTMDICPDDLIASADSALYQAKHRGKIGWNWLAP